MNAHQSPISNKTLANINSLAHYYENARQARSDYLLEAVTTLSRSFREVLLVSVNRFKLYGSRVPMPAQCDLTRALRRWRRRLQSSRIRLTNDHDVAQFNCDYSP
jgi:hypothetical protein